jgi:hypothetical protein
MEAGDSRLRIFLRIKPVDGKSNMLFQVAPGKKEAVLKDPRQPLDERHFEFARVFEPNTSQDEVFDVACRRMVEGFLEGKAGCCLAYGQTGAGKTYTVFGSDDGNFTLRGMAVRAVEYVFLAIQRSGDKKEMHLTASLAEIIGERIRDLGKAHVISDPIVLSSTYQSENLELQDQKGRFFIHDLTQFPLQSDDELVEALQQAWTLQHGNDADNASLAHVILTLTLNVKDKADPRAGVTTSTMTFVDLAGSEKPGQSRVSVAKMKDLTTAGEHLAVLGRVLLSISMEERGHKSIHVPFHEGTLTSLLSDTMKGKATISFIATVLPSLKTMEETMNTLQFAERIKRSDSTSKANIVDLPKVKDTVSTTNFQEKRIQKLRYDIDEAKYQLEHAQFLHERTLRDLAVMLGLDIDLDMVLSARPGTKEFLIAQTHKEAVERSRNLELRNNDLEKKLREHQILLEEIQRVELNNIDKRNKERAELQLLTEKIKDEIHEAGRKAEEEAKTELMQRAEDLQKLLTHSHLLLEEKSASIHSVPFTMQNKAADARFLSEQREMGRTDAEKEGKKLFKQLESEHEEQMKLVKEQLDQRLAQQDRQLAEFTHQFKLYTSKKKETVKSMLKEEISMYECTCQYDMLLRDIENGAFNQGIRPVLIPTRDIPVVASKDKFTQ